MRGTIICGNSRPKLVLFCWIDSMDKYNPLNKTVSLFELYCDIFIKYSKSLSLHATNELYCALHITCDNKHSAIKID